MKVKILLLLASLVIATLQPQTQNQDASQKAIEVKLETLKSYTGEYAVREDRFIKVTLDDGILYLQVPGQSRKVKLLARTETEFFNEINAARIKFNCSDEGKVLSLTITNEAGRQMTAARQ